MLVLVVIQAVADPTGVLALVGWSGALPQPTPALGLRSVRRVHPRAPRRRVVGRGRAGDRFWTLVPGIVLAVLLAQAAAAFAMTWNIALAAWAAGYVTAKAVPAALIVAAFARWFGGPSTRVRLERGSIWIPAGLFAAVVPLVAGLWWTGAAYAPGVPAARPDRGVLSMIVAMLLIAGATALCLRWMRARVPGVLGGWLAALVAGAASAWSRRSSPSSSTVDSPVTSGRAWPPTSPSPTGCRSAPAWDGSSGSARSSPIGCAPDGRLAPSGSLPPSSSSSP